MEEQIVEQIGEALRVLADQIGVAVEFLWAALIRQAYITGTTNLIIIILLVLVGVYSLRVARRNWAIMINRNERVDDQERGGFVAAVAGIVFLITSAVSVSLLHPTATALFNPEYWALNQILEVLGGLN